MKRGRITKRGAGERRERLLAAVNTAAVAFLSNSGDSFDEVMVNALRPIADVVALDRICVFKHIDIPGGECLAEVYRWDRAEGNGNKLIYEELASLPYDGHLPRWLEIMPRGEMVYSTFSDLPPDERAFFDGYKVKTLLAVPVFVENRYWGNTLLLDMTRERYFEESDVPVLRSLAFLCANTIIRYEMEKQTDEMVREIRETTESLARHDKLVMALNNTAAAFIARGEDTFEDSVSAGLKPIAEMAEVDRVLVFRNKIVNGKQRFSNIYRWTLKGGVENSVPEWLVDVSFDEIAPYFEARLRAGGYINALPSELHDSERAVLEGEGVTAAMAVPVLRHEEFWGFILLERLTLREKFDDVCAEALQSAAFLCANTFIRHELERDNLRQAEAIKEQLERQQLMADITRGFISGGEAGELVNDALKRLGQFTNAQRVIIVALDALERVTRLKYHWYDDGAPPLPTDTFDLYEVVTTRFPKEVTVGEEDVPTIVCFDTRNDKTPKFRELYKIGMDSFIWTGIYIEGVMWGVISVERCDSSRVWTDNETRMVGLVSNAISGAIVRDIYDQQRAAALAAAVQAKQEAARAEIAANNILSGVPMGVLFTDENTAIVDCNDEMVRMLGATEKREVLEHFSELFVPAKQADGADTFAFMESMTKRALAGERVVIEFTHTSATGEEIPCESTITKIQYGDRELTISYNYDLRGLKQAQSALAEAEARAKAMMEGSPMACTMIDRDLNIIDCNEALIRNYDNIDKQYYLDHFYELSPEFQPDGRVSAEASKIYLNRAFAGERLRFEWTHMKPSGELLPTEITLVPVKYKDDYVVMGYHYDMRGIKKMQNEILERDGQLRTRLEQQRLVSEIMQGFLKSSTKISSLMNTALARLGKFMGASRVLIVMVNPANAEVIIPYHWFAQPSFEVPLRACNGHIALNEFPIDLPERHRIPMATCSDVAAPVNERFAEMAEVGCAAFLWRPLYINDRFWGVLSVEMCDAPRLWTADESQLISTVGASVAGVIMRDIQSRERDAALDKAIVASRAKNDFLANISHEMRTPMNAIIGMTMMGKNADNMKRKDYALEMIEDASQQLLEVINDMLDMSRIESGKLELSPINFSFDKLISRLAAVFGVMAQEKGLAFSSDVDDNIPKALYGDEQRLGQVISNLLSNAVKFTPEGGKVLIAASLSSEADGVCELRVEVTDTGIGIALNQQGSLFKAFQQAESAAARKFGGTGLGLAISKRIVELMGGRIWIESELGKGATFIFTAQMPRGEEQNAAKTAAEAAESFADVSVLLVEDVEINREIVIAMFEKTGLKIDCASGGGEALKAFKQNPDKYDVIFMDAVMPDMNGFDTTRAIRALASASGFERAADVPIVAMSANGYKEDIERCTDAGMNGCVSKPLEFGEVAAELRKYRRKANEK